MIASLVINLSCEGFRKSNFGVSGFRMAAFSLGFLVTPLLEGKVVRLIYL
jgi:hypothetical protein